MFYDNFQKMCLKKGVSLSKACADLGLSHTMVAKYKMGSKPRNSTISDMCVYFGCELGELLGSPYTPDMPEKQGKIPTFTMKTIVFVGVFLVHYTRNFG